MKWEYTQVTMSTQSPGRVATLNEYGADGWELVSIVMPSDSSLMVYTFKRKAK